MKESVMQQAKDAGVLNKNVFILDSISKNELAAWYSAVSMGSSFVTDIKELWANSANKFFDTLASAKPVLINHEGWQAETIRERNIGYVLPTKVTDESAKYFVEYTQDTELHNEQCRNSLEVAKEKYSLEVAVRRYESIFERVE